SIGTHDITATYGGDAFFSASTSASYSQSVVACLNLVAIEDAKIHPAKLNLKSKANWVDVEIRLVPPALASDIDVASLSLNGVPASTDPAPRLDDDNKTLKVKFSRTA